MRNIPLFRRPVHTKEGVKISPDQALPDSTYHPSLTRLGFATGLSEITTTYCLKKIKKLKNKTIFHDVSDMMFKPLILGALQKMR